jgi:DNA modification methylase
MAKTARNSRKRMAESAPDSQKRPVDGGAEAPEPSPPSAGWPLEWRAPTALTPYAQNPRDNDSAVAAVAASIEAFGFRQPIVVDGEGVIVVGHTRWKAAQRLGLAQVPVHIATDLTPDQARAYRIADNKSNELASWNLEVLAGELQDLSAEVDWRLFGFQEKDLAQLLDASVRDGLVDADDVPALPEAATTERGDLYQLGPHRLLCGDSSDPADVDRLLEGATIDIVVTDPPYNVRVEPRSNNAIARASKRRGNNQGFDLARRPSSRKVKVDTHLRAKDRPLINDWQTDADFAKVLDAWCREIARILAPGRAFYMWGGFSNLGNYPPALAANGLYFSQAIIWNKQHPVLARKDFMLAHEIAFYGWREGAAHRFLGPPNVPDIWDVKKITHQQMVHLTEKPVELGIRALTYSSRKGERVIDFFGGSGSTMIAAHQLERVAYLMELDPLYCDVIVQRYEQFTGDKAVRIPYERHQEERPAANADSHQTSARRAHSARRRA